MLRGIKQVIKNFAQLKRFVFLLILGVFFVQLIDAALFMLFNFYLKGLGYDDAAIAHLVSFRYGAVMLVAFPLGLFIKGRRLKPFFFWGALAVPIVAFLVIQFISLEWHWAAQIGMGTLGVAVTTLQVAVLPFLILNVPRERHSEAISLNFQIMSSTAFVVGLCHFILNSLSPTFFTEKRVLEIFTLMGLIGVFFISRIQIEEKISEKIPMRSFRKAYDWGLIFKVVVPTVLIAIGAGLTIPFINLFFEHVHDMDSRSFSIVGSMTFILVTIMMLFIPVLRRRFGYGVVITLFQSLAVIALVVLGTTEWYADWSGAAWIAIAAFTVRQPLMNVAAPATSELSLYYVGEKNQELISALNASIWSGSWFFSSRIFGYLRSSEVAYVNIFLMTAIMYTFAILWYVFLIKGYYKRPKTAKKE